MPKFTLKWVAKKQIAPQTFFLVFSNRQPFLEYQPGQFASIEVLPGQRRSYSFVFVGKNKPNFLPDLPEIPEDQEYWVFLVSTKANGLASQFFTNEEPTRYFSEFTAIAPLGQFTLVKESKKPKVFICTGTGLAPILNMLQEIWSQNSPSASQLFFGTSQETGNYALDLLKSLNPDPRLFCLHTCFYPGQIDKQITGQTYNQYVGKVTEIVPQIITNFEQEFYLCGNPLMVEEMKIWLKAQGAKYIFSESFQPILKTQ